MKTKTIILGILFAIGMMSCEKEETLSLNSKILFEYHYQNDAWIHNNSGWIIDGSGNVRSFNLSDWKNSWNEPDKDGYISTANVEANLSLCRNIYYHYQITSESLALYASKIFAASKGKISESTQLGADQGQATYAAFVFDEKNNRYKRVILKIDGDIITTNDSPEAAEIYLWMKELDRIALPD